VGGPIEECGEGGHIFYVTLPLEEHLFEPNLDAAAATAM